MNSINDQDKVMAALAYPIGVLALIILLTEEMKARPFQRYHAVQALALNVGLLLLSTLLGGSLILVWLPGLLWLGTLYFARQAYRGVYVEIPLLTSMLKELGWLEAGPKNKER